MVEIPKKSGNADPQISEVIVIEDEDEIIKQAYAYSWYNIMIDFVNGISELITSL